MPKTMPVMEVTTPLKEALLFHGLHAREELGRLGEYQLDLLSPKKDINVDEILGKNVTVKVELPDESTRYFNGFVTRFAQGGTVGRYIRYYAVVRSWLWFLTRTTDCRIFQEMTVPDIVKKVFGDHPTADFVFELTGSYHKWTYCVQYRETDFNFVTRLLEHEGIYFYTRHTDGHNTVVLTDATSKHTTAPGYEKISYIAPEDLVRPELEHIGSWDFARDIQPGVYVHDDYDLERPSVELRTRKTLTRSYSPSDYEIYDYPGHYIQKPDGEQYAGVRIDEFGTQFETAQGISNSRGITVGSLFTLEDFRREDQNREYLVIAASHDVRFGDYEALPQSGGGTDYRCAFVAMPSSQQFRPRRSTPKPFVQGPQTAVVVGPAGEEIYTDKYGRVKVQFHWDRYGKKDDKSSCWIRVSHPWAGKGWGAVATPRIGQEVIVDFLEGDPDQPIITGRVYNAEQMPPWGLPGNKTQSGFLTRSSSGGSPANANAIRFEDKAGSEQVWIHAEKNQDIEVEHDETHWVGHDRTKTIDHDETSHIKHDRTETVDNNETITVHGQRTETVDKNETITIHQNRTETVDANETISIGGNRTISVSKNETATVTLTRTHTVGINEAITVGAAQEITVGAAQTITVGAVQAISVGANQSTNVGAAQSNTIGAAQSTTVGAARSIDVGAAQTTNVAANASMTIG
ncbi:MAG TPA: type VI secretion system tip protein TssI/VgrG, partial [Vicinamibacterales bacterium]|nr:type VI secretion system tip protein TssI/VgrG [Vicinamibacterales bacterium]